MFARAAPGRKPGSVARTGGLPHGSCTLRRGYEAGRQTANTHAREGTPGRHPGKASAAKLKPEQTL